MPSRQVEADMSYVVYDKKGGKPLTNSDGSLRLFHYMITCNATCRPDAVNAIFDAVYDKFDAMYGHDLWNYHSVRITGDDKPDFWNNLVEIQEGKRYRLRDNRTVVVDKIFPRESYTVLATYEDDKSQKKILTHSIIQVL